jgi:hypothetical protein
MSGTNRKYTLRSGGFPLVCEKELANKKLLGRRLMPVEAYCVKCKAKKEVQNPTAITMKNGKPATTGTCGTCGTKMFKIGK